MFKVRTHPPKSMPSNMNVLMHLAALEPLEKGRLGLWVSTVPDDNALPNPFTIPFWEWQLIVISINNA
jgi:hypothetical protein